MTEEVKAISPGVRFVFGDGKERTLYFTYHSLCRMEREHDIGIDEFQRMISQRVRVSELAVIVWAALIDENPDLKILDVEKLISLERLSELSIAILETAAVSLPKPKKAEAQEPDQTDASPAMPAEHE